MAGPWTPPPGQDTDLVLGSRSVLGGADQQVHAAPLARPVSVRPDGEHGSGPSAPGRPPRGGERPRDQPDVTVQPHGSRGGAAEPPTAGGRNPPGGPGDDATQG